MIEVYKYIQSLGHEIALHTDPLLVYQDHKMDGAQAVVDEIDWTCPRDTPADLYPLVTADMEQPDQDPDTDVYPAYA